MSTFKQIQNWARQNFGYVSETSWITDIKFQSGLAMREALNRKGAERFKPCPPEKVEPILVAMGYFGMIR